MDITWISKGFSFSAVVRVALTAAMISCTTTHDLIEKTGSRPIRFKMAGRIPVIDVVLNGKPAMFIIDTGASVSVLNESEAKHYGFSVIDPYQLTEVEVIGLGGTSFMKLADKCTLQIGDRKITHLRFRSKNMNELAAALYRNAGWKLAGILGADMLIQYRITVDFMNNTISF